MKRKETSAVKRRAERLAAPKTVSKYATGHGTQRPAKLYRIGKTYEGKQLPARLTKRDETRAHRRSRQKMRKDSVRANR